MAKSFQVDTGGTLTTGLVSYYKLGDTYDFYGSNNLTNNGGATFGAGKYNNGVDFGSSNSTKYLSNSTVTGFPSGTGNRSVSLWVKPTAASAYVASMGGGTSPSFNQWSIYINSDYTKLGVDNNGNGAVGTSFTAINDGNWHHIVATWDGSNTNFYVDGTARGSVANATVPVNTTNTYFNIGNRVAYNDGKVSGMIDEVGVWSKALSTTEISDLYNSGNGQTMNPPIEFDSVTASGDQSTTAATWNHVCGAGANRRLYVGVSGDTTDKITTATYGGVSMTQIAKLAASGNRYEYLYRLDNPATGSNAVVVNASSTTLIRGVSVSYVGVKQSGTDDASTTNTATSATSLTTSLTTVADNCWTVLFGQNASSSTLTAGAGSTLRGPVTDWGYFDSNAPITPAGSTSMAFSYTTAQNVSSIMASFAPYVASTTNNTGRFFAMF